MKVPEEVKYIIDKLENSGFEAFAVGGCVRDSLLGIKPKDWDITTSATPSQVKKVFEKDTIIPTGEKYGTLTIMLNNEGYEVTTYRADGNYSDGRRPDAVSFSKTLKEDIERRDFTINSIAYNPRIGLIDYFSGCIDIENKNIKCVGDPYKRFNEDALRILRCFRFAFKYNFNIEEKTLNAALSLKHKLSLISKERIRDELCKILQFATFEQLLLFKPILLEIIPELKDCNECSQISKYHIYSVLDHSLKTVSLIDDNYYGKLIMLLHDIGKPLTKRTDIINDNINLSVFSQVDHFPNHAAVSSNIARNVLMNLKFDNKTIKIVTNLIKYHAERIDIDPISIRIFSYSLGYDLFDLWIKVRIADVKSQNKIYIKDRVKKALLLNEIFQLCKQNNELIQIKDIKVNGNDLKNLGYEGEKIGETLNNLLMLVLKYPNLNSKDYLLSYIKYIDNK